MRNQVFLLFVLFQNLFALDIPEKGDVSHLRGNRRLDSDELFLDVLRQNQSQQLATLNYFLDNGVCQHFYWDMGTNIGIQLRKLYEPQLYPNAPVLPFFSRLFGPENPTGKTRENVCAIGFEPGHVHVPRLLALQDSYQKAGYPLIILTSTAVWNENGNLTFYDDIMSKKVHNEWGSSLIKYDKQMEAHPTLSVDIDALIHHVMYNWDKTNFPNYNSRHDLTKDPYAYHNEDLAKALPHFYAGNRNKQHSHHHGHLQSSPLGGLGPETPHHSGKHYFNPTTSKMVAKVDIEGAEYTILPHMALHGSICFFDEMMIEWHPSFVAKDLSGSVGGFMNMLQKEVKNCRFHIDNLDDETYGGGADTQPFPEPVIHSTDTSSSASSVSESSPSARRKMEENIETTGTGKGHEDEMYFQRKVDKLLKKNVKFLRLIRLPK
jgi:hypothetical protein